MITRETTDIIYNAARIEEVIQEFIDLKKRGANYLGLCPFHNEKTPSFTVSPVKEIYKCFGCGKGGNVVTFLMEHNKMEYVEALKYLAERYHITIPEIEINNNKTPKEVAPKYLLQEILLQEIDNFNKNSSSVFELMHFDSLVMEFCINNIEELNNRIKNNTEIKITAPLLTADSTLLALKGIYDHKSMRAQYNSIFNQCVVLLVSYFSAAVKELFRKLVQYLVDEKISFLGNLKGDVKLSFEELENSKFDLRDGIVDIIIEKKNISFQDMKSIANSFRDYFTINIEQTQDVDNIILGLASRHAIVHNLSQSDEKFMSQIGFAKQRQLKTNIKLFDSIEFNPNEIKLINESMIKYLENMTTQINTRFQ